MNDELCGECAKEYAKGFLEMMGKHGANEHEILTVLGTVLVTTIVCIGRDADHIEKLMDCLSTILKGGVGIATIAHAKLAVLMEEQSKRGEA